MTALAQFGVNIVPADQLVAIYRELRAARGLGARGRLDAANTDLLWLPRSAIVASIAALDAYIHSVVHDRLPHLFGQPVPPPDQLCEELSQLMPIKSIGTFKEALPTLLAHDTIARLLSRLSEKVLAFQAYQAPEKIEAVYRLIGHEAIFDDVSDIWTGPNTTANDLKRRLAAYVRRRNQIAHEGDVEADGQPRPVQPEYATGCRQFVAGLVARLNQVVYGV
jgi:hypothetical protein